MVGVMRSPGSAVEEVKESAAALVQRKERVQNPEEKNERGEKKGVKEEKALEFSVGWKSLTAWDTNTIKSVNLWLL